MPCWSNGCILPFLCIEHLICVLVYTFYGVLRFLVLSHSKMSWIQNVCHRITQILTIKILFVSKLRFDTEQKHTFQDVQPVLRKRKYGAKISIVRNTRWQICYCFQQYMSIFAIAYIAYLQCCDFVYCICLFLFLCAINIEQLLFIWNKDITPLAGKRTKQMNDMNLR